MKAIQWRYTEEDGSIRVVVPRDDSNLHSFTVHRETALFLGGTLCMLYLSLPEQREEIYFCDFRKLPIAAKGSVVTAADAAHRSQDIDAGFGFRRGSGCDALWLGSRGWQPDRVWFRIDDRDAPKPSTRSLPQGRIDVSPKPSHGSLRLAGMHAAALFVLGILVVFAIAGQTSRTRVGAEELQQPLSPRTEPAIGTVVQVTTTDVVSGISDSTPPARADEPGKRIRKKDSRHRIRETATPAVQQPGRADVTVPCTRDMIEKGIPCS